MFDRLQGKTMNPCQELVSKVLVLDGSETAFGILRIFCHENHLIGLRTKAPDIAEIFNSNIGLGAILISEEALCDGADSLSLSKEIHQARPNLPIFLRRYDSDTLEGIPEEFQDVFTGAYCLSNLEPLKNLVQAHLFDAFYPADLVSGIKEAAKECVEREFKLVDVVSDTPYLVHDNIMGEFNCLISLESSWCRGYMMLQTDKDRMMQYIQGTKDPKNLSQVKEQDASALLIHLTNEIWGAINRKFISYGNELDAGAARVQVPLFIDPDKRYISFGCTKPQLCYRFEVNDEKGKFKPLDISMKLIFNLDWSPENFAQSEQVIDELIESGELEMF